MPLALRNGVAGLLSLSHDRPGYYTERHAGLVKAIANQAAIAIENARLYEQAQQAARSTETLARAIASRVAFGGSLESLLDDLGRLRGRRDRCGRGRGGGVPRRDGGTRMVGTHGLPRGTRRPWTIHDTGVTTLARMAASERAPLVLNDARRDVKKRAEWAPLHRFMEYGGMGHDRGGTCSYGDKVVGVLRERYYLASHKVEEAEIGFHKAIANQAAVAVENAVCWRRCRKSSIDSASTSANCATRCSRALFSINLTAVGLETLLQRSSGAAGDAFDRLADLRQMTQGALAEMRALIFELRPGALKEEGLLPGASQARFGGAGREMLRWNVIAPDEATLPRLTPVAEVAALYRIAQEALHNVVKHARASRVRE